MTASNSDPTPRQQIRDWLFARLGGELNPDVALDEAIPVEGARPEAPEADPAPSGPPEFRGPEDLQAANEWLQRERRRLGAYTQSQLAQLQQQHQALVAQNYLNEQTLILRSQELARNEELLVAQGRALHRQSEELSMREQALVGQLAQWCDTQKDLDQLKQAAEQAHQETAAHRGLLEALESQTASLEHSKQTARAELDNLLNAVELQREARAREEEMHKARQLQLEQRLREAERVELACQQRLAELDDLEAHLRREFEDQERKLTREQQEREGLWEAVRRERKLSLARQAELDRRLLAVEEAERACRERQQEQDFFQEKLEQVCEELAQRQAELGRLAGELDVRERLLSREREERSGESLEQRREAENRRARVPCSTPAPGSQSRPFRPRSPAAPEGSWGR
jgi:hypothetical protein